MRRCKFLLTFAALFIGFNILTGCHTVAGAGQDVSETGQTVTHAANAAANSM